MAMKGPGALLHLFQNTSPSWCCFYFGTDVKVQPGPEYIARKVFPFVSLVTMDSQIMMDGRMIDLIDERWREDKLPMEDVAVPQMELPELEPDNGPTIETLREQEQKWADLNLHAFNPLPSTAGDK